MDMFQQASKIMQDEDLLYNRVRGVPTAMPSVCIIYKHTLDLLPLWTKILSISSAFFVSSGLC